MTHHFGYFHVWEKFWIKRVNCQPSVANAASRANVKSEIRAVGLRSAGKHPNTCLVSHH